MFNTQNTIFIVHEIMFEIIRSGEFLFGGRSRGVRGEGKGNAIKHR